MNEFKEQITIITGGANGIGKALAQTLGRAGAHVVIGDINDELGSLLSSEIRASGGSARYQHTDVRVTIFCDETRGGRDVDVSPRRRG